MVRSISLTIIFTSLIFKFAISQEINNFLLCYTCSSLNASVIVGRAGVDPGVFLSTIPLTTIPVTRRCIDPYDSNAAVRVGVATDFCDKGLCVKMNFTDKVTDEVEVLRACMPRSKGVFKETCTSFSSSQAYGTWCVCDGELCNNGAQNLCYSCTTMDADKLMRDISDPDWQQWLNNVRDVPRTPYCGGANFDRHAKQANMIPTQQCDDGICMKLYFKERHGGEQMWRTCVPNGRGQVRTDCTKVVSSEGDMEVCTCAGDLCNGANSSFAKNKFYCLLFFISILLTKILFW